MDRIRTRIRTERDGAVTIRYVDAFGRLQERRFVMRGERGCVREIDPQGAWLEVCDRLANTGVPLFASRAELADTIRREYRRMRAEDKRFLAGQPLRRRNC